MEDMRIYVASLSDYNNGRLEGKWFDLADYLEASDLMGAIQDMLDELTEKYKSIDGEVREEWAVHDYEGIPSTLASEYMGEQDFQQLYEIAEVAEDRGIPVAVLVERAGDTGSDDYQALADSLMFVVDGNDETDIVHEYESQLGELGSDFWSNHIYVDDVTERVIYGEDVDRIREDILYENPDMDEDEAERQAEELADEEAERRADLTTYLEDMGYGDEIPSWVSKDYEGAWKRSLSYDLDVIHHDGEMYVFSNNYGIGGTILSGMVGAYIGYKIGRARPQKIGFGTEVRIGNSVKDSIKAKIAKRKASKKKKYARGGNVNTGRSWHLDRARHNKRESYEKPLNNRKGKFEDGGRVGQEIVFDDNGEENTGVIKEIHEITGDYIVNSDDGRTLLAQRDRDVISLGKMRQNQAEAPKKRFGFFEEGGGVSGIDDLIRG
jgi:antirestriction protein